MGDLKSSNYRGKCLKLKKFGEELINKSLKVKELDIEITRSQGILDKSALKSSNYRGK